MFYSSMVLRVADPQTPMLPSVSLVRPALSLIASLPFLSSICKLDIEVDFDSILTVIQEHQRHGLRSRPRAIIVET